MTTQLNPKDILHYVQSVYICREANLSKNFKHFVRFIFAEFSRLLLCYGTSLQISKPPTMGDRTPIKFAPFPGIIPVNNKLSVSKVIVATFPCLLLGCPVLATSEGGLRVHMAQDHPVRFRCPLGVCEKRFGRKADADRHMGKHGPPKYHCPVVGCLYNSEKGFYRKDKLTSHAKSVHLKATAESPLIENS